MSKEILEVILSEGDIAPASAKDRAYFSSIFTGTFLTFVNAVNRQALANLRLDLNTGGAWGEVSKRFSQNPATLVSGLPYRFTLQMLTQGAPLMLNRIYSDPNDPDKPKPMSSSLTALWMTTAGGYFEVAGLAQPIKDKAKAVGIGDVNFLSRSPVVATCILPVVFVRNSFYTKLVFGQSDEDLSKKVAIAVVGGAITNPLDVAINVGAYEAAIAKDGTPVTDIFRSTWRHFMVSEKGISPYQQFMQVMSKSFSGVSLRMGGVGGAALIFSKPVADAVQEGFENYIAKSQELWSRFQSKIVEHGGVDLPKESKVDTPSTAVQILNHEQLEKGGSRETEA